LHLLISKIVYLKNRVFFTFTVHVHLSPLLVGFS